jgi:hypothetical protein
MYRAGNSTVDEELSIFHKTSKFTACSQHAATGYYPQEV